MRYTLAVLTHGESRTLDASLASFWEYVSPWPSEKIVLRDGDGRLPSWGDDELPWDGITLVPQRGFCAATRALWGAVSGMDPEFVFWLEHDFVFNQPLDLRRLADVLDDRPQLAQMALMRNAVNEQEKAAGGLYEFHEAQGSYEHHGHWPTDAWLAHKICFTTNPSLMRTEFMRENPWPEHASQCEGRFSFELRDRGYMFGHWGAGEVWIEHIGIRDGFGY